ncbi:hypothetical protein CROQUDRAFT_660500 [Cronartium quercuum f. sp. fusiforme G11]|uniref:Uncharacterized protein n=1 Tax=Cronartium quercuum f. sp. fusiforme G11 TaxID=708437 RepID=A0A9P6T9U8_9BASI|nr:hypothetical protein CROQUDRAFT_660500 [Cronartium quercuum f. sp. fusiforme G11]
MSTRRPGKGSVAAEGRGATPVQVPAPQDLNGVFNPTELVVLTKEQHKAITKGNWVAFPLEELTPMGDTEEMDQADGTVMLTHAQSVAW